MNIDFYFGQGAKKIRGQVKTVEPDRKIIYGRLSEKKDYKLAPQFNNQNCFKIGKTQSSLCRLR